MTLTEQQERNALGAIGTADFSPFQAPKEPEKKPAEINAVSEGERQYNAISTGQNMFPTAEETLAAVESVPGVKEGMERSYKALHTETLTLEYPALAEEINQRLADGWDKDKLRKALAETESYYSAFHTQEEIDKMLGRTDETKLAYWEAMDRQKDDAYVRIMHRDMSEDRVRHILHTAKLNGLMPGKLLMAPKEVLQEAEKLAGERYNIFMTYMGALWNAITGALLDSGPAQRTAARARMAAKDDAIAAQMGAQLLVQNEAGQWMPQEFAELTNEERTKLGREALATGAENWSGWANWLDKGAQWAHMNIRPPEGALGAFVFNAIENSGFTLLSAVRSGLGWAAGGPIGGLIMSGYNTWSESESEAGNTFIAAKQKGWSDEDAWKASTEVFMNNLAFLPISNFGGDLLLHGAGKMFEKLAGTIPGTGWGQRFMRFLITRGLPVVGEAVPEGVEELAQDYFQMSALKEPIDSGRLWEAFRSGMAQAVLYSLAGVGTRKAASWAFGKTPMGKARAEMRRIEAEAVEGAVLGAKLARGEIKPDEIVGQDPVVFVPRDALSEEARQELGIELETMEAEEGAEAPAAAVAETPAETDATPTEEGEEDTTPNEIAIRKSVWDEWAAKHTEEADALKDRLREGTKGVTAIEALDRRMDSILKKANESPEFHSAEADEVRDRLTKEFTAGGRPEDLAKVEADTALRFAVVLKMRNPNVKMSLNDFTNFTIKSLGNSIDEVAAERGNTEQHNQIIGEKGAARLDEAEGSTIRQDNYQIALKMREAGKDAKAIKLATGWDWGADGEPRYEILDGDLRLGNVFNTPEKARYHRLLLKNQAGTLTQTERAEMKKANEEWARGNREGQRFKLPDVYENDELYEAYPELRDVNVRLYPFYLNGGSWEADKKRIILSLDKLFHPSNRENWQFKHILAHEIQHAIQDIEGFARGAGIVDGYERYAGEVESRNVQWRMDMTEEERRNTPLADTEDVRREDQILLGGEVENYAQDKTAPVLRTQSGVPIEEADIHELLLTPDGSTAFGVIDEATAAELSKNTGREIHAGEIRLDVEGLLHTVWNKHGEQIKSAKFPSVGAFFLDVLGGYTRIYQGADDSLLLVKPLEHNNALAAIELSADEPGVYLVQTGWIIRDKGLDKKQLLFTRSESLVASPGPDGVSRTASDNPGEAVPNALPKSNSEDNISQTGETVNNGQPAQTSGKDFNGTTTGWKHGEAGQEAWNVPSIIKFFETANASTGFHELGHHMLRVMMDVSKLEGASDQLKADVNTILKHAGVTMEEFDNDLDKRIQAHEFFARSWEVYLGTGKAPTPELQGVFFRLHQWFKDVYHNVVEALGIKLSPEMQDVFDRILATPDQTEMAEYERNTSVGELTAETDSIQQRVKELEGEIRQEEAKRSEAGESEEFHQIIGERGAAKLDVADAGNRIDNLGVAREMEQAGKDAKTIWLATGWQKGKDGKWGYDILDGEINTDLKLSERPIKIYGTTLDEFVHETTLGELYDSPELYAAYPKLKDTRVIFQELGGGTLGRALVNDNAIVVSDVYSRQTSKSNDARIKEIEETPEFKAYNDAWLAAEEAGDEETLNRIDEEWEKSELGGEYNNLLNTNRVQVTAVGRPNANMKSTLVHEIQHLVQEIEGFAPGGNEEIGDKIRSKADVWAWRNNLKLYAEQHPDLAGTLELQDSMVKEYEDNGMESLIPSEYERDKGFNLYVRGYDGEGYEDAYNLANEKIGFSKKPKDYETYKKLTGEVQSRNAEKRMNMTAEERRQKLLSETEDVAREDQIVLMDALGANGMESFAQIGTKRKGEMDAALAKNRPDMSEEQRAESIAEIEKLGEEIKTGGSPKAEKAATKWLLGGHIILPEDNYKIKDALRICEQEHLDPMSFADPNEILAKYTIRETKAEKRIDPDTVPEFSNRMDYRLDDNNVISVYAVQDDEEGMAAVRKIIDTHWGEDANPWCLAARDPDDGSMDNAWEHWEHYSAFDKSIVFKNGKLLAFGAASGREFEWWDREDNPYLGIPFTVKQDGNVTDYMLSFDDGEEFRKVKETLKDGTEIFYDEYGEPLENDNEGPAEDTESYAQTDTSAPAQMTESEIDEMTRDQIDAVRKRYEGTDQYMKAPNGADTKLTEKQWLQVRTDAFKQWFGDWENDPQNASKVVDENGEPLVVWHGTPEGTFSVFRTDMGGAYFSADRGYAEVYARERNGHNTPKIYGTFLNIKKPFDTRDAEARRIFEEEFFGNYGNRTPLTERGLLDWTEADDMIDFLQENGYDYDGLIVDEGGDPNTASEAGFDWRGISYVALSPEQIKSATDNRGTFDAGDMDIYHQDDAAIDTTDYTRANEDNARANMRANEAASAVDTWLYDMEDYNNKVTARQYVDTVTKAIRANGGLRLEDFVHELGEELATELRKKWSGLFRNTTQGPQLELDVLTETLKANGIDLDVQELVDWLQNTLNEIPERPVPPAVTPETLDAMMWKAGPEGVSNLIAERKRWLEGQAKQEQAPATAELRLIDQILAGDKASERATYYRDWIKRLRSEKNARIDAEIKKRQETVKALKAGVKKKAALRREVDRMVRQIKRAVRDENVIYHTQQEIQKLYEEAAPLSKSIKDVKIAALRELHEKIMTLQAEGRRELELKKLLDTERINRARDDLMSPMLKRLAAVRAGRGPSAKAGHEDTGKLYKGLKGKAQQFWDSVMANTMGANRFFDWLDGANGTFDGAWVRWFVDRGNEATNAELQHLTERRLWIENKAAELGINIRDLAKTRDVGVPKGKVGNGRWTVDELMSIYAGMKNENSRAAILYGNFGEFGEDAEAMVAKCVEGLTDKEKAFADAIIEEYEINFDRINDALIDVYNRGMTHEKNYTPIRRLEYSTKDGMMSPDAADVLMGAQAQAGGLMSVEKGFTKSRMEINAENQSAIDLGLFSIWNSQVEVQEHAAAFGGLVRDMRRILMGRTKEQPMSVQKLVKQVHGDAAWKNVKNYFNIMARDNRQVADDVLNKSANWMARNMSRVYLCANLGTATKQFSSFPRFLPYSGLGHLLSAIGQFTARRSEFLKEVYALDPQLAQRQGNLLLNEMKEAEGGPYEKLINIGMAPIGWVDRAASAIGWKAVYDANIAKGLSKEDAIKAAQRAVLLTQPTTQRKDAPRLWQQGGLLRLAMMFTNDCAQTFGINAYDMAAAIRRGDVPRVLYTLAGVTLAAGLMRLLTYGMPDDDDDESWLEWGLAAVGRQSVEVIPILGKGLVHLWDTKGYDTGETSPYLAPFAKLMSGANGLWDDKEANDERAWWNLFEGASLLAGFPAVALHRLRRVGQDVADGDTIKALQHMIGQRVKEKKAQKALRL